MAGKAPGVPAGLRFAALCSVPFVMVLSNSLLIPVLPTIRAALDTSYFRVGLLITAFSVPAGITIPLAGVLSDYLGRKAVIVPALVLFGLGGLVAGLAGRLAGDPYGWLLAGRILQGIGGGGTYQIALALAGDAFQRGQRARAMGALEAANALGKVVSPVLGGLVALLAWYAPFFVYPLLAWPSAAAVAWLVPEPREGAPRRPLRGYLADLRRVLAARGVMLTVAFGIGGTMLFMLFGVLSWLSDVLEARFGMGQLARGMVIAVPVLVAATASWLTGSRWLRGRPRVARTAVLAGTGLVGVALLALAWQGRLAAPWGLAAVSLLGLGYGMTLPAINAVATGAADAAERGLVTSLYGTVRFLGAAFGPPAFELVHRWGVAPLFLGAAAWTALMGLAAWRFLRVRVEGGGDAPGDDAGGAPRSGAGGARPSGAPG